MLKTVFSRLSTHHVLLGMAWACVLSVIAALVGQYQFDMRPCAWCVLQRAIYLLIGLLCIIAAYLPPRAPRMVLTSGALVLAALGAAAAVYQHVVAAKLYSCNLTLADTIISALRLEALLPALFQITGSCADAAVSVLGVPFEYWSLLLFILLALAAASVLIRRHTD